jgi:hypothetical protein
MKTIEGVIFGNIEVVMTGKRDWNQDYDFGALTLKCEDREFMLDVVQSYTNETDELTTITLELEPDEELFDECPYNLTKQDLQDSELIVELFVGGTFENEIVSMTFKVEIDGQELSLNVSQD